MNSINNQSIVISIYLNFLWITIIEYVIDILMIESDYR